jgi:predicted permease
MDDRPDWARDVRTRLASLRLSPTREAEIVEELAQHLDDRWRELVAGGAAPDAATELTRAEFRGGDVLARYMAPLRQAQVAPPITPGIPARRMLGDLWQDLRYARRAMLANPAFTAVAVLSLAIGLGADTAIFGLWNGVLHSPLPAVRDPDQLVMLSDPDHRGSWSGRTQGPRSWLTYGEFEQLRDHADGLSAIMASQSNLDTFQVRLDEGWEEASGRLVSGGFFHVLGVEAAIGRLFTAAADRTDAPDAVVSYAYWQRRFGGSPDVLGRTLTIRTAVVTIVGVAPRGFIGETSGQQPDLWLPLRMQPAVLPGADRLHDTPPEKVMWLHVFGRLQPGVSLAQVQAQANAVFSAGLESFYGAAATGARRREFLDQRLVVRPATRGASSTRRAFAQSLTALLIAVAVLLLIACANLANLLLARGATRKSEMAVRLSLGASRGRLVRQLVTESLLLAVVGGIGAIAVAYVLHGVLVAMMTKADSDFAMTWAMDPPVLLFLFATTLMSALLCGMLPAWQVTKTNAGASLREQSRGTIGSSGQLRSGRLLVIVQLALSLPLLVSAGLLARTAYNLQRAALGFPAERLLLVRVNLREPGYEGARRDRVLHDLVDEIRRTPGVQAASFSQLGLFSGGEASATIEVEGFVPQGAAEYESALDVIGPRYFAALGVPLRVGRDILENDTRGAANVCVINDAFAKRFFSTPERNPIGMRITLVNDDRRTSYQVVGVAGNARTLGLRGEVEPRFFVPMKQPASSANSPTFLVRTTADPGSVLAAVRKAIQGVDAAVPIMSARTVDEQMLPLTAQDRTTAQLALVFGCAAVMLAAIGLYGMLSFGIARRTAEIAIRMALGAPRGRVVSMILGEAAALVGAGLTLGGGLAYTATRLIDSRLYGVAPHDPVTLAGATGLLLIVAFAAAYLPARRAASLDPVKALRQS